MKAATPKVEAFAERFAALGNPVRLSILRLVVQGDPQGTPVGDLQARLDIPWSTLSHHIERLTSVGLLTARREGTFIFQQANYAKLRALTEYLWEDCCKRGAKSCC